MCIEPDSRSCRGAGAIIVVLGALTFVAFPGVAYAIEPPAGTLVELAERDQLKAGKAIMVRVRLSSDGAFELRRVKLVRMNGSDMIVEVGEDFLGTRTDLPFQHLEASDSPFPFADESVAMLRIPEDRVMRVAEVDGLMNGILIGAAIGAAPGILLTASYCGNEYCSGEGVATVIGVGAALGAGIGALADYGNKREGTVLFEADRGRAPDLVVSATPLTFGPRKGVVLTVSW